MFGRVICNTRGAVLLLTFIFMVTLSAIAASYIFLVTSGTRTVGGQTNNMLAFYLAEAGLNKAVWYLLNTAPDSSTDGSWRTSDYPAAAGAGASDPKQESLGAGTYTMWVQNSGSSILITARGTVSGLERFLRQTFDYDTGNGTPPESFTYANYAGGDIDFGSSGGTAQVAGDIAAEGNIDNSNSVPVSGTSDDDPDIELPVVDYAAYEAAADQVINGNKTFAENSTSGGIWYVKGNVTVEQGVTINGTIIAEGNINLTGNNITVTATSPYPALIAQGDIAGDSNSNYTITGSIFTEGNLTFNNINNFTFTGSIVAYGNIELSRSNNFNITFVPSVPPFISDSQSSSGGGTPAVNSVSNTWAEI